MSTRIKLRRDTAANWTAANPVLADGEEGYEKVTGKRKVGDGTTAWNSLPYDTANAPVQTVAGRSGAVVLTKTDVGLPLVDNTADTAKPVSTAQQAALDLRYLTNPAISAANPDNTAAIQALIDALAASTTTRRGLLPAGNIVVNGTLTWPVNKVITLQGQGWGGAAGIYATQLARTTGTQPILAAIGTGDASTQRVQIDLRDIQFFGNDLGGTLVRIERAYHARLDNIRIAHNIGGIGLRCTNWNDCISSGALIVEYCGGVGTFTGTTTNASTSITGVSSTTNIQAGTVLAGAGLQNGTTVVSVTGTTVTVDRAAAASATITVSWVNPAHIWDATPGSAMGANASVYIASAKYQANYGTELRFTGTPADTTPSNDIAYGHLSLEHTGAGTSATPDTYPYIDLDYAQLIHLPSVRISIPTGRAPNPVVQQIGSSAGLRANMFGLLQIDVAGTSSPPTMIDMAAGALTINTLSLPSTTLWSTQMVNIRSSVSPGRFRINTIQHASPNPYTGFISDHRALPELISKGKINVAYLAGTTTAGTTASFIHHSYPDASTTYRAGQVVIPEDADPNGQCRLRIYWTCATGDATKDVYWQLLSGCVGADTALASSTYDNIVANTGTANTLMVTDWSTGPTCVPGGLLSVYIARLGAHASDTLAQAVLLVGAEIIYDRRLGL